MDNVIKLNVVIEISKNSKIKYEYHTEEKRFYVDRILYGSNVYPQNYGFIENTLDYDGDPLDVLIIADQAFLPGSVVPTRILGLMEMIDSGETDTKLIGVIDCDPRYQDYQKITNLPQHLIEEIKDFFINYKNLQKKKVEIGLIKNVDDAAKEIKECQELFQKYKNISKKEFIVEMEKLHPQKYRK